MSMSQEEIEALMNGLDEPAEPAPSEPESSEAEPVEEESTEMSADDIENLIAQTQEPEDEEAPAEDQKSEENNENDIDDLLAQLDQNEVEAEAQSTPEPEDVVETAESIEETSTEDVDTSDIDELLAGIDGVSDDEAAIASDPDIPETKDDEATNEAIARAWTNDKVDKGVFPSPVEPDTKVVGQLSQVANDSEEKAGQIFDVLSLILDENNVIQQNSKSADQFIDGQIKLLSTLTQKFPNIAVFKEQLDVAISLQGKGKESSDRIDSLNMKIFEAMEQMQFFDINRQKIERVMSVIKKLSNYLNNLFEDTEGYKDVQIAKHIHGDSNEESVDGDDLEALIAEFNK